ncbi:hypothetical protein BCF33_1319 [Hasllibacter halocynthiae]|uniref:Uncharacterized protein n=1 Tax=Hasllibacter halocynthiae TaxID=595589 RepID=A0A2T0X9U6_9RHOB|nr:hypothetical protein [Hasllibacter halocynthiae]PRY95695.1 hypothetical protein BCF33_1319 [Hasllibacter halocynthiae]
MPETLLDLVQALRGGPEVHLVVSAPSGVLGPGWHVTELRRHRTATLGCDGIQGARQTAEIELMAGGGRPLTPARLLAILERGAEAMPSLGDLPLRVAAAPDGALQSYRVAGIEGATLRLEPLGPACPGRVRTGCCAA